MDFKKWGTISAALAGVVTPWLFIIPMLGDVNNAQEDVSTAKADHAVTVEAQGETVEELQTITKELVVWGAAHDNFHAGKLVSDQEESREMKQLRDRVVRLEAYVELSSKGKYEVSKPTAASRILPPAPEQRTLRVTIPKAEVIKKVRNHKKLNVRRR
jgi:hypothetical protein